MAFGGNLDYMSGAGYLGSELFSFMVPLLLLIAAIGAGARATAGKEERGTLDLLLANPLPASAPSFSATRRRRDTGAHRAARLRGLGPSDEIALLAIVLWLSLLVESFRLAVRSRRRPGVRRRRIRIRRGLSA